MLTGIGSPATESIAIDHAAIMSKSAVALAMLKKLLACIFSQGRAGTYYSSVDAMACALPSSFVANLRTTDSAARTGFAEFPARSAKLTLET